MTQLLSQYFFPMENIIQDYVWGSHTSINELLGIDNPNNAHQAEIWMGAHANGCSKIKVDGETQLLSDFINQDKAAVLTAQTDIQFDELPYLFKVLAAGEALSVQVHPSKAQAEAGFAKEEAAGIPRNAVKSLKTEETSSHDQVCISVLERQTMPMHLLTGRGTYRGRYRP